MDRQQQSEQQQKTAEQQDSKAHLGQETLTTLDVLCSLNQAGILPR